MNCVVILKNTDADSVKKFKKVLKKLNIPLKPLIFTSSTLLLFFPAVYIEDIIGIDFSPAILKWHII